jgi:hypothetical protein
LANKNKDEKKEKREREKPTTLLSGTESLSGCGPDFIT